ncbi:hypothetical protein [Natrinema versiforme]|uniref:Uncharacterized protein n=1 Tax=Natrinema versiforme TaxID=88724 RepID=A0A4P8WK52_9EURY|nr:hypothetical protein [Natrinema versiforme]QCS43645.1 hypothetical protein FEJ81_15280 [Natrinema versiforme]
MSDRNKLTTPTDLKILNILATGRRHNPRTIAHKLDREKDYMGTRLRFLRDLGYLQYAVTDNTSIFEITERGLVAAWHADQYVRDHHDTFHEATLSSWEHQPENEFLPDIVWVDTEEKYGFIALNEQDVVVPSEIGDSPDELPYDYEKQGIRPEYTGEILYRMYWHGFAERVGGIEAYRITDRGELVHELITEENVTDPVELTQHVRDTYSDDEKERLDRLNRAREIIGIDP